MSEKTYRVIQWATGTVGKAALKHFIENPVFELVGVLRHQSREGRQGRGRSRRSAHDRRDRDRRCREAHRDGGRLRALRAAWWRISTWSAACCDRARTSSRRPARSSRQRYPDRFEKIEAACREGGTSFHGCGIHPGFSGDILPLTLTRLMDRIDRIEVTEIIDKVRNPMIYIEIMGFGLDPDELLAKPRRSAETPYAFEGSMRMVVEGLGKEIEKVTTKFEVAKATKDIPYPNGVDRKAARSAASTMNGPPGWMAHRSSSITSTGRWARTSSPYGTTATAATAS